VNSFEETSNEDVDKRKEDERQADLLTICRNSPSFD
jgi:hypothetical protein